MATTNLSLDLINGSDYVSPDPINHNFETLDRLGKDYVVESGTSGEWWYRKWKSGRAECGIDSKSFGSIAHDTKWGSFYVSKSLSFGAYPFSFSKVPYSNIVFTSGTGHSSFVVKNASTSTTVSPTFYLVDPNSKTMENSYFGIKVEGRYK